MLELKVERMAGWLPWGKHKEKGEEPFDVEKYLKDLRIGEKGFIEDDEVTYVKSINLSDGSAVDDTIKEIERSNIVVLNIRDMLHSVPALKDMVGRIRRCCVSHGGDLCRISEAKIMVLPKGMEVAYPSKENRKKDV